MKKNLTSEEILIQKRVYFNLANILYDRTNLPWDELLNKALFLYKYNALGGEGVKDVALYLYKIYNQSKENYKTYSKKYKKNKDKNKGPQVLFVDKDELPLSLGKMEEYSRQSTIYREIAVISQEMRKCIKTSHIDEYIFSLREEIVDQVQYLKCSQQIDKSIQEGLFKELDYLLMLSKNHPEDIFRQIKCVQLLLKKNTVLMEKRKIKEEQENLKSRENNLYKVEQLNKFMNNDNGTKTEIVKKAQNAYENLFALQISLEQSADDFSKRIWKQYQDELSFAMMTANFDLMQKLTVEIENILEAETNSVIKR